MIRRPLALLVLLGAGACADQDPTTPILGGGDPALAALAAEPITVMSRNLYLGADLGGILAAESPQEVVVAAGAAWQAVLVSDVPGRAAAWADEIAAARPHLVGLQEAAAYWTQSPGDFLIGNPQPATDLQFDFVALLLAALEDRGTPYYVAAAGSGEHLELPMLRPTGLEDVRMLLRDVILARSDVGTSDARTGNYDARLELGVGGLTFEALRGWASVDARIGGRDVHFVTTHLEAFHPGVQEAQAAELVALLEGRDRPTILVGDLNSTPDGARTASYGMITGAGFTDAWTEANGPAAGPTCCHDADLRNAESGLDHRIDYVLVRDAFRQSQPGIVGHTRAWLVGESPEDRLAGGLWPSDHAGVVAALRLPVGGPEGH